MKIAILIPCYQRPEYTEKCVDSIEHAQEYENTQFFAVSHDSLRDVIIEFFNKTADEFDLLGKIDNDCMVPKNYLNDIIEIFETSDVDILSPNVMPSNAAFKYGTREGDKPYMPAKIIGGLWFMKSELVRDMKFESYNRKGIAGAHEILKQIIMDKEPVVGWTDKVVFQDAGHWSGKHPEHIKSDQHANYSKEVGREIAW